MTVLSANQIAYSFRANDKLAYCYRVITARVTVSL